MRHVVFAVAGAALLGAGPALSQSNGLTAESPRTQAAPAAKAPVKMAVSHPSTKLGAGPSPKPSAGPPIETQNQLVAPYCAGCHRERGKAGGVVPAGFDGGSVEQSAGTGGKEVR